MKILPLHPEIQRYITLHNLKEKFEKQSSLFEQNPFHPSLHTELLEPKEMRIWSFRVDKKFRAIFIFRNKEAIEILDVNNHYQ
ncbi:MAG: hypothetical protein KGZ58_00445 [Ignavibacteriales bacterium]|nr:hypothetical protein [Ignavibacteriales bacterium]